MINRLGRRWRRSSDSTGVAVTLAAADAGGGWTARAAAAAAVAAAAAAGGGASSASPVIMRLRCRCWQCGDAASVEHRPVQCSRFSWSSSRTSEAHKTSTVQAISLAARCPMDRRRRPAARSVSRIGASFCGPDIDIVGLSRLPGDGFRVGSGSSMKRQKKKERSSISFLCDFHRPGRCQVYFLGAKLFVVKLVISFTWTQRWGM